MTEQQQELYDKLLKKVNEYCLGQAAEDVIAAIDDLVDTYECSGQTSFEVLDAIKEQMPKYDEEGTVEISKTQIRILETELKDAEKYKKALEIIKEHRLDIDWFLQFVKQDISYEHYVYCVEQSDNEFAKRFLLNEEEYERLKEMLK